MKQPNVRLVSTGLSIEWTCLLACAASISTSRRWRAWLQQDAAVEGGIRRYSDLTNVDFEESATVTH